MKSILRIVISLVLLGGVSSVYAGSSNPATPVSNRLSDGTNWITVTNPLPIQGTLTGITNPIAVDTTQADQITSYQGGAWTVGFTGNGTVTAIDGGLSLTVDTAQLPSSLDANSNLKVHEQGTANVKLDSNIDTSLGKVKITDGTDVANITSGGAVDVNVVSSGPGGTVKNGRYTSSVPAGTTKEIGSYTVTAGKTLYVEGYVGTLKGDALWTLKVSGTAVSDFATSPIVGSFDRYVGDNFSVAAGQVISVEVTNSEASAITSYFSWHGTEK